MSIISNFFKQSKKEVYDHMNSISGKIINISDPIKVCREGGKLHLFDKQVVKLKTLDGQVVFIEFRDSLISKLTGFQSRDYVKIKFRFNGSEKNGKTFNNLYANKIERL